MVATVPLMEAILIAYDGRNSIGSTYADMNGVLATGTELRNSETVGAGSTLGQGSVSAGLS